MKRKMRNFWTAAVVITLGSSAVVAANADPVIREKPEIRVTPKLRPEPATPQLRPEPYNRRHGVKVQVWTDIGEGGLAYPGEAVSVYFRTNHNAYVVVYSIDTRGRKTKLFPRYRGEGFVQGGRTVALPDDYDDYQLTVTGPRGTERIVALASTSRIRDREWEPHERGVTYRGVSVTRLPAEKQFDKRLRHEPVRRRISRDETWFEVGRQWWCPY